MTHRNFRVLGALVLAATLLMTTLAGTAVGSTPKWEASLVASPAKVTAGDAVQLIASFRNQGPSNISQLFLTLPTPSNTTYVPGSLAFPSGVSCQEPTATTPLTCSYGAVTPSTTSTVVTAVYLTAADQTSASTTALWSSTGVTSSDGGTSHGDSLSRPVSITLVPFTTTQNFAGRFVRTASEFTVGNGNSLSNSNKQSTQVTVQIFGIPVTVEDGSFIKCGGYNVTCPTSFFGETSQIEVANGALTPIDVRIVQYKTVNANKVHGVYHSFVGTDGLNHDENITQPCATAASGAQCFTATDLDSQTLLILVHLIHNGRINGW
jgi:uncharacterized repeat protein (TIGR01451 family)